MRWRVTAQLFASLVLSVILTLASAAGVLAFLDQQRLPSHTRVAGIDLGGMSYRQAGQVLTHRLQTPKQPIVFRHDGQVIRVQPAELGIHPDIETTLRMVRDQASFLDHIAYRGTARELEPVYAYDPKLVEEVSKQVASHFDREARNARVYLEGEQLRRQEESEGFRADRDDLIQAIKTRLHSGNLGEIEVPGRDLPPRIKLADLAAVKDLVAVYVTPYNPAQAERAHNMALAASRVNNTLLMPGDTFSLNQVVGERSAANGYQKAPVFEQSRLVSDFGGGVCQVATTLYNVAVQADLKITQRQPHSLPVTYIPLGQDATVAWEQYDLKFVNSSKYPVLITMRVADGKVQARVYSKETDPDRDIRLVTEQTEVEPQVQVKTNDRLAPGQQVILSKGSKGYRVKTYRVVSQQGKEISRTLVSDDYYRPRPWIVEVGPHTTFTK